MKNLFFLLVLVSATAVAQKNQISLTMEGNLNPVTYSYINQGETLVDSQKSSLGGAVEYDHWFTSYQAFGVRYEQNPSDGREKNALGNITSIWPQTRSEFVGILTQHLSRGSRRGEFQVNKFTSFLQEGAGAILTCECSDGNKHYAGWSHSAAFAAGAGTDYSVSGRLYIRLSTLLIATATGCYDDPRCRPTTGVSHDLAVGFTWKWGGY